MEERARPLLESDVDRDPLRQFEAWFDEARGAVPTPEAMTVATAAEDGAPAARMVLLKVFDERGFVFYTGYTSRKGGELAANSRAALLLYWEPLGRQVRIEGSVERTSAEQNEQYFHSRPRSSQIAALASRQSQIVPNRDALDARFAELDAGLAGNDVPLPPEWGGFRLVPEMYEFWQHRENRLHDRLRYSREAGGWKIERLSP